MHAGNPLHVDAVNRLSSTSGDGPISFIADPLGDGMYLVGGSADSAMMFHIPAADVDATLVSDLDGKAVNANSFDSYFHAAAKVAAKSDEEPELSVQPSSADESLFIGDASATALFPAPFWAVSVVNKVSNFEDFGGDVDLYELAEHFSASQALLAKSPDATQRQGILVCRGGRANQLRVVASEGFSLRVAEMDTPLIVPDETVAVFPGVGGQLKLLKKGNKGAKAQLLVDRNPNGSVAATAVRMGSMVVRTPVLNTDASNHPALKLAQHLLDGTIDDAVSVSFSRKDWKTYLAALKQAGDVALINATPTFTEIVALANTTNARFSGQAFRTPVRPVAGTQADQCGIPVTALDTLLAVTASVPAGSLATSKSDPDTDEIDPREVSTASIISIGNLTGNGVVPGIVVTRPDYPSMRTFQMGTRISPATKTAFPDVQLTALRSVSV